MTDDLDSGEIEKLATYDLLSILPPEVTDADLREAEIYLKLNDKHEVVLQIRLNASSYAVVSERWQAF